MTKKLFMVVSGVVLMVGLAACSGKEGPMGPTGPTGATGPGSQTVYTQDVTPLYEAASLDLNCPEIVADPNTGQTSTVVCYLTRTGYDSFYVLPVSLADTASGTTAYSYKISTGILTLLWDNSSALVPPAFQVRVTVVNQ